MRKRNNFISVFTMFLAIGFAIIFSRPVKATANGVQLKANRTYTAYDVTGDGTKDKIRIRAANQTDDEAYSSLTVSVNGKTAYRLKNTRFYNVIANIYTLKNGQPFLYLYAPAENGDGPVCALLKYTNRKFRKALDFTEIMAGYGNHRIGEVTNLNGNKIVLQRASFLILLVSMQLISPTNMSMENLFRQADMDLTKKYIPQMEAADISQ